MKIIYLTSDLLFSSRVNSLARQAGIDLVVVGSRDAVLTESAVGDTAAVFVDLEHRDANVAELVKALGQRPSRPRIVAYGPHVKDVLLQMAQAAGCDEVLTRGQFDKLAGTMLAAFAGKTTQQVNDATAKE